MKPGSPRRRPRGRITEHRGDPRWRPDINPKSGRRDWARFRGRGRRGRQSSAVEDAADLGCALKTLSTATEQLVRAHSRVIPSQRRAEVAAALGMLALVTRQIDEIIMRRGGTPGDVVGRGAGC